MKLRLAAATALLATACEDPVIPAFPVDSVELSSIQLTLGPSQTHTLTATPRAANGQALDRSVSWNSSDPLVATVSSLGVVTALSYGTATIQAASEGKTAQAALTVTATLPSHLAGQWRMQSFSSKTVPATYAFFPDEPTENGPADVTIRLDSAKMTVASDGKYTSRQYCFSELHDGVFMLKYCWGDHGVVAVPVPGSVSLVSEYIQNLSAFGSFTSAGTLSMIEELWISEAKLPTVWTRQASP